MRRTLIVAALATFALLATAGGSQAAKPPKMPISLTSAMTFFDPPGCDHTRKHPCATIGTFTANDQPTADLLCPSGTMNERFWFPTHGPAFTIADRTVTCPDGSTLLLHVKRVQFTDLTPTTALIGETWTVTLGTGRFSNLTGQGTMNEIFDTSTEAGTLGGSVTGFLR
jgi:hypothetical protein